jgi:hypothetical protein
MQNICKFPHLVWCIVWSVLFQSNNLNLLNQLFLNISQSVIVCADFWAFAVVQLMSVLLGYGAAYWVIGAQHFKAAYFPHLQWLKCPISLDILTLEVETPW